MIYDDARMEQKEEENDTRNRVHTMMRMEEDGKKGNRCAHVASESKR